MTEPAAPAPEAPAPAQAAPQLVPVINPSGELVHISAADVPRALDPEEGYRLASADDMTKSKPDAGSYSAMRESGHGIAQSALSEMATNAQGAYTAGGFSGFTGGLGPAVIAHTLDQVDPEWSRKYRQAQEDLRTNHETAYGVGNVAGHVARDVSLSLAGVPTISGAVEGVAARGLAGVAARGTLGRAAASGLAHAAGFGAEGAVLGAAQELSEESLGPDHQLSAEKILAAGGKQGALGAAFGFGLGAGGSLLKSGVSAARSAISEGLPGGVSKTIAKASDEQAAKAVTGGYEKASRQANGFEGGAEGFGQRMKKLGIVSTDTMEAAREGTPELMLNKARAAEDKIGKAIGEIHEASPATIKLGQILDASESVRAPVAGKAGFEDAVSGFDKYRESLLGKLAETGKGAPAPIGATEAQLNAHLREVEVPIQDLIRQRKALDDLIFKEGNPVNASPRVEALQSLRGKLESIIVEGIDDSAKKIGDAGLKDRLLDLKKDYQATTIAVRGLSKQVDSMAKNRTFGLTDYLSGGTGAKVGAAIGGLAAGAPGAAVGGLVGGAAGTAVNKFARQRGNAIASAALDRMANLGQAAQAVKQTNDIIANAAKGAAGQAATKKLTPPASTPLTTRYADAVKHVAAVQANPDQFVQRVTNSGIQHAPNVSAAMAVQASRALAYLASQVPQNINRQGLGGRELPPRASDQDMATFVRKYEAVTDPVSVLRDVSAGRVSSVGIEALRATNPLIFGELQQQILQMVAEKKAAGKALDANQRIRLGIIFDAPTDPALQPDVLRTLQQSLAADSSQDPNQPSRPVPQRPITTKNPLSGFDAIEARGTNELPGQQSS